MLAEWQAESTATWNSGSFRLAGLSTARNGIVDRGRMPPVRSSKIRKPSRTSAGLKPWPR